MAPEKDKKQKAKTFWVLKQAGDGLLQRLYSGPDKGKAREAASRFLREDPKAELIVAKLAAVTVLIPKDLESTLPRDAF